MNKIAKDDDSGTDLEPLVTTVLQPGTYRVTTELYASSLSTGGAPSRYRLRACRAAADVSDPCGAADTVA